MLCHSFHNIGDEICYLTHLLEAKNLWLFSSGGLINFGFLTIVTFIVGDGVTAPIDIVPYFSIFDGVLEGVRSIWK